MSYVSQTIESLERTSPGQPQFYEACKAILVTLRPLFQTTAKYREHNILPRFVEPERQIMFRITWVNDRGGVEVANGYRIQFNSVLGPYKGGLRFHPDVNAGIMKALALEQVLKNSLTGLALGGSKGGSNFDPKGRSDNEIMRFCQAFMSAIVSHIGPAIDVPGGDIGVGSREIGYLYGQYRRLTGRYEGALTGKGIAWGGSAGRKEATGYGAVYFAMDMLAARGDSLEGKTCVVSGAGNVAIYTVEKLHELGANPVAVSDSTGMLYHPSGVDPKILKLVKETQKGSLVAYRNHRTDALFTPVEHYANGRRAIWSVPCHVAFPSATENELTAEDVRELLKNGCQCVCEGANMPATPDAAQILLESGIAYGPGKAANAGGVAISQLEMSQNAVMQQWSAEEVDRRLRNIMSGIYATVSETAREFGSPGNFVLGANIAGFRRVADAMIAQGVI
jgi:glutamate dehydrogenase (NADP+)